jgi:O-antigen ligase
MKWLALLLPAAAVLWSGTSHPPATLALAAASALLLLLARQPLRLTPLALPPLALALMCALQLLPLRNGQPLSLDPPATLDELAKLLGASCLAIGLQRLGRRDRDMLRASLALAGAALVGTALLDALGVPLPHLMLPIAKVRAPLRFPLGDPNHAASLLLLLLPLIVHQVWKQRGAARLVAVACWIVGNTVLAATASRAGFALGLGAQAAAGGWLARRHQLGARWWLPLVAVPALALALAGGTLMARLAEDGSATNQSVRFNRLPLWRDALAMVRDHLFTGVGRGGFEPAFALYDGQAGSLRHGFVENQYLQVLADGGLLGVLLMVIAATFALRWLRLPDRESGGADTAAMALVSLAALALHNAVEFSIEAGGVAAATCAVGALALASCGPVLRPSVARPLALLTLMVVLAAGLRVKGARADEDLEALIAAPVDRVEALAEAALARHPADGHLAAVAAMRLQPRPASVRWLERALQRAPHDLLAHHTAVRVLLAARETDQAAGEMRQVLELSPPADVIQLLDEATLHFGDRLPSAVPPRLRVTLLARLTGLRRWPEVDLVGRAAIADQPDDAQVLRMLLQGALQTGQPAAAEWAGRLAAVSHTPDDGLLIARALLAAGRTDDAERVVKEALARAVDNGDKVNLHLALAEVADRQGNSMQAALERRRANELLRH